MYIISILAVIIMSKFFTEGNSGIFFPLNPFPLILMLLFIFSLLAGTSLLKDFNNAFRLSIWKGNHGESENELKRAIEAVSLVRKILLTTGSFLFFFEASQILLTLDLSSGDLSSLGYMVANGLIGFLYAATISLVLLPMESMLKLKLWNTQKSHEILKDREIQNLINGNKFPDSTGTLETQDDLNTQNSKQE